MSAPENTLPPLIVEAIDVHKSFGPLEVLKGINLPVRKGEVVWPARSVRQRGKSTFLRCINHLERMTSGRILVDGQLTRLPRAGWRASRDERK